MTPDVLKVTTLVPTQSPRHRPARRILAGRAAWPALMLAATVTLCSTVTLVAFSPSAPAGLAVQDAPTGGGMGCKSHGNCNGTLYRDKSNLDRWWYPVCSKCHVVQASAPADMPATLTRFQQDLVSNKDRFWQFHADAAADPVLARLAPATRLVPPRNVPPPYRALLSR